MYTKFPYYILNNLSLFVERRKLVDRWTDNRFRTYIYRSYFDATNHSNKLVHIFLKYCEHVKINYMILWNVLFSLKCLDTRETLILTWVLSRRNVTFSVEVKFLKDRGSSCSLPASLSYKDFRLLELPSLTHDAAPEVHCSTLC